MFECTHNFLEKLQGRIDETISCWPEELPSLDELKKFREQLCAEYYWIEEQISYFYDGCSNAMNHLDTIIESMEAGEVPEQEVLKELSSDLYYADRYNEA